ILLNPLILQGVCFYNSQFENCLPPLCPPVFLSLFLSYHTPMNKIIFTEEFCQPENLYPFTLTRQIQDIRVGILTIREKWERMLNLPSFDKCEDDYKDIGNSVNLEEAAADSVCFMIHGNVLPEKG